MKVNPPISRGRKNTMNPNKEQTIKEIIASMDNPFLSQGERNKIWQGLMMRDQNSLSDEDYQLLLNH
jgi:hypothetical protein